MPGVKKSLCAYRKIEMNIVIGILLLFALLGAVDKIFGGKWGVAEAFDQGLATMGSLCLSMSGIYCIAITFLNGQAEVFRGWNDILPFDSSVLSGVLLAPDMGGFAIADKIAESSSLALYSGLLLSSTLGCLVSFVLPIALGALDEKQTVFFLKGTLLGILTLPLGLIAGGVLLKIDLEQVLRNLLPVVILCVILSYGLKFAPQKSLKVLALLGNFLRIVGIVLALVLIFGVFFPAYTFVEDPLLAESLIIVLKITVVVCGSMVAVHLALTYLKGTLQRISSLLGVNEFATVGLLISLATSISMIPLFSRMDERGKKMNAAFCVSGAFCMGGQLAFVSSVSDSYVVGVYLICKLLGGLTAIFLVRITDRR